MPLVSVILTSFNHERFIAEAIQSVLDQTFTDFELIISDDCSTDKSWEIIQSFSDSRIKAFRSSENNLRVIIDMKEHVRGKYVAVHHSDDVWLPDKLARQVDFLENNPKYAAVFSRARIIDENSIVCSRDGIAETVFDQPNRTRHEWLNFFVMNGNALCHPSVLIRKDLYGGFERKYIMHASLPDLCIWIDLCMEHEIYIIQEPLVHFRKLNREMNTSGQNPQNLVRVRIETFFIMKEFFRINSIEEIIRIFPQAEKYLVGGEMVIPFALSRIVIEHIPVKEYLLAVLEMLHDLLRDDKTAADIKRLYGYDHMQYAKETAAFDVFSALEPERFLKSELFADFGQGFVRKDEWCLDVFVNNQQMFSFDVHMNAEGVKAIRFVPDTVYPRGYRITKALTDGVEAEVSAANAHMALGFNVFSEWPEFIITPKTDRFETLTIEGQTDYSGSIPLMNQLREAGELNQELIELLKKSQDIIKRLTDEGGKSNL